MEIIKKFKDYFNKDKVLDVYSVYNLTYDEIEYTLLSFLEELDDYVIKPSACRIKSAESVTCLAIECIFPFNERERLIPLLEKAIKRFNGEYNEKGIQAEYSDSGQMKNERDNIWILIYNPKEYTNDSLHKRNMRDKSAISYNETPFAKSYRKKEHGRPWFTIEPPPLIRRH